MLPCLRLKSACLPQVWKTLTAYERLPEFLPNLLLCERLQPPEHTGNSSRVKRIRQVGSSGMSCSGVAQLLLKWVWEGKIAKAL